MWQYISGVFEIAATKIESTLADAIPAFEHQNSSVLQPHTKYKYLAPQLVFEFDSDGRNYGLDIYPDHDVIQIALEDRDAFEDEIKATGSCNLTVESPEWDAEEILSITKDLLKGFFGSISDTSEFQGYQLPDKIVPEKVDFLNRLKKEADSKHKGDIVKYFYNDVLPIVKGKLEGLLTGKYKFDYWKGHSNKIRDEYNILGETKSDEGVTRCKINLWPDIISRKQLGVALQTYYSSAEYDDFKVSWEPEADAANLIEIMDQLLSLKFKPDQPMTEFEGYQLPEKLVPEKIDFLNRLKKEAAGREHPVTNENLDDFIFNVIVPKADVEHIFMEYGYRTNWEPFIKDGLYQRVFENEQGIKLRFFVWGDWPKIVVVILNNELSIRKEGSVTLVNKFEDNVSMFKSTVKELLQRVDFFIEREFPKPITEFKGYDLPEKVVPEKVDFLNRLKKEAHNDYDRYFNNEIIPGMKLKIENYLKSYGFELDGQAYVTEGAYQQSFYGDTSGLLTLHIHTYALGGMPHIAVRVVKNDYMMQRHGDFEISWKKQKDVWRVLDVFSTALASLLKVLEDLVGKDMSDFKDYKLPKEIVPEKVDFLNRLKKEAARRFPKEENYLKEHIWPLIELPFYKYTQTASTPPKIKIYAAYEDVEIVINGMMFQLIWHRYGADDYSPSYIGFIELNVWDSQDALVGSKTIDATGFAEEDSEDVLDVLKELFNDHFTVESLSEFNNMKLPDKIVPEKIDFLNRLKKESGEKKHATSTE